MRANALILAAILVALPAAPARAAEAVSNEIVVQLQPGTNVLAFVLAFGLQVVDSSAFAPVYRMRVPLGQDVVALLGLLRLSPVVVAADPNLISRSASADDPPNDSSGYVDPGPDPGQPSGNSSGYVEPAPDPAEPQQNSAGYVEPTEDPDQTQNSSGWRDYDNQLTSTFDPAGGPSAYQGQSGVGQVHYYRSSSAANGSGVMVAILDTGISRRPAAIRDRVLAGWNYLNDTSNADDAPAGIDYDRDGKADEAAGHGTMIGSIVLRFAPGAWLLPVKVGNSDGYGTLWAATEGIRYAAAKGARVLNLSFGFGTNSGTLNQALKEARSKGAVLVASAGNGNTRNPQYPAASPDVLSIAAVAGDDTKAQFSNYGGSVDAAAPGVDVVGTFWDGSYTAWSGTSFAAPFVAAQAAVIRSRAPRLTADDVRNRILGTARPIDNANPDYVKQLGRGVVDFDASLAGL